MIFDAGYSSKDLLPLNQITVSEVLPGCSTLMCMKNGDTVYINTPMKEVKEYFGFFGITIKGSMMDGNPIGTRFIGVVLDLELTRVKYLGFTADKGNNSLITLQIQHFL